jgi:hypothetical protein
MNIETLAKDEFIKSTIEKNFLNEKIFILAFEQGYKTGYSSAQPEMYTIIAFKEDLINNKGLSDLVCLQNNISIQQYNSLLDWFISEQNAIARKYAGTFDVFQHWKNWVKKNIPAIPQHSTKTQSGKL